jgi:hypothetical protein
LRLPQNRWFRGLLGCRTFSEGLVSKGVCEPPGKIVIFLVRFRERWLKVELSTFLVQDIELIQ